MLYIERTGSSQWPFGQHVAGYSTPAFCLGYGAALFSCWQKHGELPLLIPVLSAFWIITLLPLRLRATLRTRRFLIPAHLISSLGHRISYRLSQGLLILICFHSLTFSARSPHRKLCKHTAGSHRDPRLSLGCPRIPLPNRGPSHQLG